MSNVREDKIEEIKVRVPASLKKAFFDAARRQDLTASQAIRKLMRQYVDIHRPPSSKRKRR